MKHSKFENLLSAYHGLGERCGARNRKGLPCMMQALQNGRCRFHGGLSTGAKTKAGLKTISNAQKKRWATWRENQANQQQP